MIRELGFFLAICLIFAFVSYVDADVIAPGTHPVERCVKIVDINKYPEVELTAKITGPMVEGTETKAIIENECLSKGYKFNTMSVYIGEKLIPDEIEPYGGATEDANPLVKETFTYKLVDESGVYRLRLAEKISEYNDGTPALVEKFGPDFGNDVSCNATNGVCEVDDIQPENKQDEDVKKPGFFESIGCFFSKLFGGSC